jgi:aryl-alcohol dehydrogenase-like predicted oxidoreductase
MLILGTAQFGLNYGINNSAGKVNLNEVYNIFEYALENGIQTLDTASVYGNAHEIIGGFI